MPADRRASALDPDEAFRRATAAGLVVIRANPLNCETSLPALVWGQAMPSAHFYVRNHFQVPNLDPSTWTLRVHGQVERPLILTLDDLRNLPSQSLIVTLECAGNGRAAFSPKVDGEQWDYGAVSSAEWTGVALVDVLDRVGMKHGARDVVFRGADSGAVATGDHQVRFERSLNITEARGSGALLAYAMNGEPLTPEHGFPVRLVVPGWYGMASVKWLTDIEVAREPFAGFFQADRYVYEWQRETRLVREPVSVQRVRSLITEPLPGGRVALGALRLRGLAWSGAAPIARVQVSVDGGTWQEAEVVGERKRHAWVWWEMPARIERSGLLALRSRAIDTLGRTQPEQPEWNRLGYGSNAIQTVTVEVR